MSLFGSMTRALAVLLLASLDAGAAVAMMPQDRAGTGAGWTTDQPLAGQAIPCTNGHIKDFECQNVELLSYLPSSAMDGAGGLDMWGWNDSTTGREFAIVAGKETTAFVEVTDPLHPKYLGQLPGGSLDMKIYHNHAFIVDENQGDGMRVVDLTQLRDVKNAPATFKEAARYDGVATAHNLVIDEATGTAFAVGSHGGAQDCGPGLHMIDIRKPEQPSFIGCYTDPKIKNVSGDGYVHDAQCTVYNGPDAQYHGREICVSSSGNLLAIFDVTDKQHPKTISTASYPNVGFVHQGWFTEDQRYFFVDDEADEVGGINAYFGGKSDFDPMHTRTIVFDLNDLDDPVVLTQYFATTESTDHNLYVRGHYMYQGNYGAGFRAVDVADPAHPKEAGYLTNAGQAWTTFPFYKDDVVAFPTDLGLFLVRLQKR